MAARRSAWALATVSLLVPGLSGSAWTPLPATPAPALAAGNEGRRAGPTDTLTSGKFLVASRALANPTFARSVVLLFSYSKDGAAGLIVNRPTQVSAVRLLPDLRVPHGPPPFLFLGGPVTTSSVRALERAAATPGGDRVLAGVDLLSATDSISEAAGKGVGTDRLRVYAGYAGWASGQLELEIRLGAWHVMDGRGDLVFDPSPETVWSRLIRLIEVGTASTTASLQPRSSAAGGLLARR